MWCQSCKTLQITPEDKIYKLAKHKNIQLKNDKVIHLLHFNERGNNNTSAPETDNNGNLIARNAFQESVQTSSHSNVAIPQTVQTEQPRPVVSIVNEAFSSDSISSDKNTQGDVSLYIKPEASSTASRVVSEMGLPLESYETFSKFLTSTKFKSTFKGGFDCLDGDATLGFSVYFRRKIKLDSTEPKLSVFDTNMNNLQSQMASTNPPLLFYIHGVGGSSIIWQSQLEFFNEKGYEIIALDLVGHGLSSIAKEANLYEFLEMSSDILQIFDMFANKNNNNVVIGHSYGSSFATYLAQHRKHFIAKLILIAGGAPYPLEYRNALLNAPLCCIKILRPILNCRFYW
jgi:hypothetical protein